MASLHVVIIVTALLVSICAVPLQMPFGGLFSPISRNGEFLLDQAEHLAAFMMAVGEINNKNDGIYDDILPNVQLLPTVNGAEGLQGASHAFTNIWNAYPDKRFFASVSALPVEEALFVNDITTELKSPQIVSVSNSYQYNDKTVFPYMTKSVALETFDGMVAQYLVCGYFNVRKVVTVSSAEFVDIVMMQEFIDETYCRLDYLASVTVHAMELDFGHYIEELLLVGARYFVVFMTSVQTASFIEQAYKAGLFDENSVIVTSGRSSDGILNHFSSDFDYIDAMTGFFTGKYWPNYYINRTELAKDFALRWRAQASTAGSIVAGSPVCSDATDATGSFYLYRSQNDARFCTGLDFSTYDEFGYRILPYTTLTYDATMLMALALDFAIENSVNYSIASNIQDILVNNISYDGVSGLIDIFEGMEMFFGYARGNRETGHYYYVKNFNKAEHLSGGESFVNVGYFSGDDNFVYPCEARDSLCRSAVYKSPVRGDYSIPPDDMPPIIIQEMKVGAKSVLLALGAILLMLVAWCCYFVVTYRKDKIVKASQPILLYATLLGGFLIVGRIWTAALSNSEIKCSIVYWFGHLSFVIIIGSLFVKSYRIHRIVNTKTIRRITFSSQDAVRLLAALVSLLTLLLIINQSVSPPMMISVDSLERNQETLVQYCSMEYPQFQTALYALEFVLLACAFYVCYETRNVPDTVNESKLLSVAMSSILLICLLIMPIIYLLSLPPDTKELIASLGFGLGGSIAVGLLFVPKSFAVHEAKRSAKVVAVHALMDHSSKKKSDNYALQQNRPDDNGNTAPMTQLPISTSHDVLKGKTSLQCLGVCQEQVQGWQELLFRYQGLGDHESSSTEHCVKPFVIEELQNLEDNNSERH